MTDTAFATPVASSDSPRGSSVNANDVIADLEALGCSAQAVHYVVALVVGADIHWQATVQRVRRAREKRRRVELQANRKPALKLEAIEAFRATCVYCQRTGTSLQGPDGKTWALDRILAGKWGGEYEAGNVTLACDTCNQRKGACLTYDRADSLLNQRAA